MEFVGHEPTLIHATIHTKRYNHKIGTQLGKTFRLSNPFDDFHTYTLNWTPHYIKAYVDGNHYFTYEKRDAWLASWPFDASDFKIIINNAVGGSWGGVQGIDNNIFPTYFTIDYVRQYQNGYVSE